jgi:glycogen synthase
MGWFPEAPGGLNRYFFELLRSLPATGVAVEGFVVGSDDIARATNGTVRAVAPRTSGVLSRWLGMRRAWGKGDRPVDPLAVCHFAYHAFPLLDRLPAHRFVLHFHGPWAAESDLEGAGPVSVAAKRLIERAVYGRAGRAIVLSNAFADILHEDYGVARERISIVPGGVDVARFQLTLSRSECRARLGWPPDRPVVFAARRLVRRMGLEHLVEAASLARAEVPDLLILIAGRGPLETTLAARIQAGGLERTVRLLGRCSDEDLALAYRAADLCVVPSVALEGFGLVAAESLAAGTPVLVTPVGGLPEVVSALSTDLILRGRTAEDITAGLVAALRGAITLPNEAACRRFARTRYDWAVVAAAVSDIYHRVAEDAA